MSSLLKHLSVLSLLALVPFAFADQNPKPLADIPFELRDLHIFVKAKINGQGPFDMNIDTGGFMCVSGNLAKHLSMTSSRNIEVGGAGAGSSQRGFGKIQSVRFGDVTLSDLDCVMNEPDPNGGLDAGIGPELFQRFTVYFDYDHLRMRLYQKGQAPTLPNSESRPIRFYEEKPLMEIGIGGRNGWFMVDTGAGISIIMQENYWREKQIDTIFPPQLKVIVGYGVGGPIYGGVSRLPYLRIGSYRLNDMIANYSEMKSGTLANPLRDGLLGQKVLRHFNAIYDYANQRIVLQPSRAFSQREAYNRTGIVGQFNHQAWQIDDVLPQSSAAKAGLQKGDRITMVNGEKVTDEDRYRMLISKREGTQLKLQFERGGKTQTTSIILKDCL